MKIKKSIKNLCFATALTVSAIAPAYAQNSVEFLAGDKSSFVDVQINADLTKNISFFSEGKFRETYDNEVSAFSMLDLYGNIGNGFLGILETQANSDSKVVPRTGVAYTKKTGNLEMFFQSTASLQKKTDFDVIPFFKYSKPLTKKTNLVLSSKSLGNFGANGLNYGVSMNRVGVSLDNYTISVGSDLSLDSKYKPSFNNGFSVMKNF